MTKTLTAGGLLAVLFVGDLAYADVPTAADMIACNEEAREAVRGRTTGWSSRSWGSRYVVPDNLFRERARHDVVQ